MSPGCGLPWTIFPDLRPQPLLPSLSKFSVLSSPHINYPTANEAESEAWASANSLPDPNDLPAVIKALAQPKSNPTRNRIVVFTHGTTIIVRSSSPDDVKTYAVNAFKDEEIVDTDGVGDAFAGGLLGALATGKLLGEAIGVVHTPGTMFVTQAGPQYK